MATSLLLAAVGAVLIWGIDASIAGVELATVGWICLIVGILGLILSVVFRSSTEPGRSERTVVDR